MVVVNWSELNNIPSPPPFDVPIIYEKYSIENMKTRVTGTTKIGNVYQISITKEHRQEFWDALERVVDEAVEVLKKNGINHPCYDIKVDEKHFLKSHKKGEESKIENQP